MKPVCLVLGAGAGIGGTVAAKFASKGYHSYLCRRSDKEGLDRLIANIEKDGGTASGCLLNAADDDVFEQKAVVGTGDGRSTPASYSLLSPQSAPMPFLIRTGDTRLVAFTLNLPNPERRQLLPLLPDPPIPVFDCFTSCVCLLVTSVTASPLWTSSLIVSVKFRQRLQVLDFD